MKKHLLVILLLSFAITPIIAQNNDGDSFGIKVKGFVKTDVMLDTRQTVTAREGHFLLYPVGEALDVNGDDVNEGANLNMLSIQSRVTGTITAPDFLGAKSSGVLEGAFFGHSNSDINGFRLRHAFLKLDWENSTLLIGQYWHPMFITECFPDVVSFNTGVPFQPFSRNPQIRFIQKFDDVQLTLVAASQRDFTSTGPGGANSSYLRDAGLPILDANLKYVSKNLAIGAGVNLQSLKPKLVTPLNYKSEEKINGVSFIGFAKVVTDDFTIKVEGVYGDNMYDLLMLGGYAVESVNATTEEEIYTPIKTLSTWTDISFGKEVKFGVFAGYTKNLGSDNVITGSYYSRGNNIASVMRVSPRVSYQMGNTRFASELEYTSADYGTPNNLGEVENTTSVANVRLVFSAYLFF
ncbi:MAG: hypothetical protein KKA84_08445 [Bacteroidetes bacterium]|nr:hypothetical protein [Bacteroidota bacterium]